MYSSNSTINDKNKDNLARNIRYLRNKRGLTQKELGDALFISNTEICQYEMTTDSKHHRYPKPEMLTSIAQFFGISIDDLLNHDLEANNQVINVSITRNVLKHLQAKRLIIITIRSYYEYNSRRKNDV